MSSNEKPLKHTACTVCRRQKLRCDGGRPTCGTCVRRRHDCLYDNKVRSQTGPKRGYVKNLEARLAEVEKLLSQQSSTSPDSDGIRGDSGIAGDRRASSMFNNNNSGSFSSTYSTGAQIPESLRPDNDAEAGLSIDFQKYAALGNACPWEDFGAGKGASTPDKHPGSIPVCGQMADDNIGALMFTGLSEQLPPEHVINELEERFFSILHSVTPIVHRPRYMASLHLPLSFRPSIALRYAIWALAASITPQYQDQDMVFYERARHYVEQSEVRGMGEGLVNVGSCQAWALITLFEFKKGQFIRAWMSSARACRLAQMLGFLRLDREMDDFKKSISPPRDFIEKEERRRTFWLAYTVDRFASLGTGWPCVINDEDIGTDLPCNEDAWEAGVECKGPPFGTVLNENLSDLSPFSAQVLTTIQLTKNLRHLHSARREDESDPKGLFWTRHQQLDDIFYRTVRNLPLHLRIPGESVNQSTVFLNLGAQTNIICLHQAAMCKAEKYGFEELLTVSKHKCMEAATQIVSITKMIDPLLALRCHPFTGFALYVSCRVFLQGLKDRPNDLIIQNSLDHLLQLLSLDQKSNVLVGALLTQIKIETEGRGGSSHVTGKYDLRTDGEEFVPCERARWDACDFAHPPPLNVSSESVTPGVDMLDTLESSTMGTETPLFSQSDWKFGGEDGSEYMFADVPSLVPEASLSNGMSDSTPSGDPSPGATGLRQGMKKDDEFDVFESLLSQPLQFNEGPDENIIAFITKMDRDML